MFPWPCQEKGERLWLPKGFKGSDYYHKYFEYNTSHEVNKILPSIDGKLPLRYYFFKKLNYILYRQLIFKMEQQIAKLFNYYQ